MSITKFNKGNVFRNISLDAAETKKLAELYASDPEGVYHIAAIMFSNKGKFGRQAFIVSDTGWIVWLPKHCLETAQEIVADSETVEDIKADKCGFVVTTYTDDTGATRYSVEYKEVTPKNQ